ncbi:MAG: anaerobic ribonucleoside-triphosphate reductase activating protein [Peptostreptococcaceae bacterium]
MRYAKIGKNDIVNGKGVSVSFWAQGCPHRCPGCHNQETWDFKGGKEFTADTIEEVLQAISANGVTRNLSILGGEPLAPANLLMIEHLISAVRNDYPQIDISMWTGYQYEDLKGRQIDVAHMVDYLIDGEFIQKLKDITIGYAGSSNQRMIDIKATKELQEIKTLDNF